MYIKSHEGHMKNIQGHTLVLGATFFVY